jgi:TrpR-related protein YerC/YecD
MEKETASKFEKELAKAFLLLKTEKECLSFLRDILSAAELSEISKRLKTAELLEAGVSYPEIISETGLSSTTVARISKWLKNGMGGYRLVLHRMHQHS